MKASSEEYLVSIKFLSQCFLKFYGNRAVILIDEYDVPLESAYFSGFYEKMISMIRSLFESALKTNASLEFTHDEVKQMLMTCGNEQNEEVLNWSNMSSNSIVRRLIERADVSVKQEIFYRYLKKISESQKEEMRYCEMTIPNSEVRYIYKTMVLRWFEVKEGTI